MNINCFSFRLILVFALLSSCSGAESQVINKINGISLVSSNKAINIEDVHQIKNVEANHAAVIPFGFIRDIKEPLVEYNLEWQWFGETKAGVRQYVNLLKSQDIDVMLKPQLWVSHGMYTGLIEMKTEEDWLLLEKSYSEFILSYAQLAEELEVPIFCIGTELIGFVMNRPIYWEEIILKIREQYQGKITYAANWDEFDNVLFWEQLDFIGVDAYFPLTEKNNPSIRELEENWAEHKDKMEKVSTRVNRPVMFTEFGYRSVDHALKEPWSSQHIEGDVNLKIQATALQSLFNAFWHEEWFAGGFVWKWFPNHAGSGGTKDNRFTPQNKPAEKVIKEVYQKHP